MTVTPQVRVVPERSAGRSTVTVDVVIPVYNEERALPGRLEVLGRYLQESFPFAWSITVVDNASTDDTLRLAHELAGAREGVRVLHVDRKGRGRALRTAWGNSDADVVAYMDVDLSTGLGALLPLVAPLVNGHSDLAVGSRLAPGARTVRGGKRELISRSYNTIVRWSHGARFSDAQCGFKAARTDVIRPLLKHVRDDSWFFDTELLLVAEYNGLRISEVPVEWVEDTDTRVDVVRTAKDDLAGLMRVARAKATGTARAYALPKCPAPRPEHPQAVLGKPRESLLWQVVSFGAFGAVATVVTAVLFALLRSWLPILVATFIALTVTTLWNTEVNRRYAFHQHSSSTGRIHLQGLTVFALYYAMTSGALLALHAATPHPTRPAEVGALLCSSVVGTAVRFVLMRSWVFRDRTHATDTQPEGRQ